MTTEKKMDIVQIDWWDVASFESGLLVLDDIEDLKPCKASIVGFLVKETKDCWFLAKELWENGQFKYLHVIPKGTAIDKIRYLKENEPLRKFQPKIKEV